MARKVHPNDHVNMGQSSNDVFPDRDARGGRDGAPGTADPVGAACCATTLAQKAATFRDARQDRPHPLDGRDPADPRPGDLRLGAASRQRAQACRGVDSTPVRAGAGRHGRRHGFERAPGVCRSRGRRAGTARPAIRSSRPPTSSRRSRDTTHCSSRTVRSRRWRRR